MSNYDPTERSMISWMRILCAPIQRLEDVLQQMLTMRTVDTALGVNLDIIGRIVGQSRVGAAVSDDEVYRRYIRAKILTNKSRGLPEDLIAIARLVLGVSPGTGNILIRGTANATFIMEIRDIIVTSDVAAVLQAMLTAAVSAGVRIVIVYGERLLAQTFRLDSGPGLDQGHLARGIDYRSTDP